MIFSPRFRQGVKAAIPIWIAFVPSSVAWGIAAQAHGLRLDEIIAMSAWVYSGPAQFAVLEPLATGQSSLQVLIAGTLMNLRFLPMSAALAPYFAGTRRLKLLLSCHFVSASSFIVPYLQFQKERESIRTKLSSDDNLDLFLGVGVTSFIIWVMGSSAGYAIALGVPHEFDEVLKFILPGYFAGLLVVEMRGWTMPLVCLASLLAAVPASSFSPAWGWITMATLIASLGWGISQWHRRVL
jgi:predicted branched-subunit amino acid permease